VAGKLIRTVRSKTSWAADGFDHDHGGKRATTVRRGEADDRGSARGDQGDAGPEHRSRVAFPPRWTLLLILTTDDQESYDLCSSGVN